MRLSLPPLAIIALLAFVSVSLPLTATYYFMANLGREGWIWALTMPVYLAAIALSLPRRPLVRFDALLKAQPVWVVPLLVPISLGFSSGYMLIFLQIIMLFINSLIAAGLLLRHRDNPAFYSWAATGILVGGMATLLFRDYLIAYPLIIVLLYLLRPGETTETLKDWSKNTGLPLALGAMLILLRLGEPLAFYLKDEILLIGGLITTLYIALYAVAAVGGIYYFRQSNLRMALGLLAIILVGSLLPATRTDYGIDPTLLVAIGALVYILTMQTNVVFHKKNRFGDVRVVRRPTLEVYALINNGTHHAMQYYAPEKRREPLSYFHRQSPLGKLYQQLPEQMSRQKVGVVGLGAGTIAAYSKPGQHWTFFEINPVVVELTQSGKYFTYLADAPATIDVLTDNVLSALPNFPDQHFDVLILDAYSGPDVPFALLTKEAFALYRQKVKDNGLLILHVSSNHFYLYAVVAAIAETLGLVGAYQYQDSTPGQANTATASGLGMLPQTPANTAIGEDILVRLVQKLKAGLMATGIFAIPAPEQSAAAAGEYDTMPSEWVVLTRDPADLEPLWVDAAWRRLKRRDGDPVLHNKDAENPLVIAEFLRKR